MKKIVIILIVLLSINAAGQTTSRYSGLSFKASEWMRAPNYFIGTTSVTDTAATHGWVRSYLSTYSFNINIGSPANGLRFTGGYLYIDTAKTDRTGAFTLYQYNKLSSAYTYRLTSATGTSPLNLTLSSNALTGTIDSANTIRPGYLSKYMYSRILDGSSKWTLNGSDIYRMSKVGIGVATPLANLHIKGDSAIIYLEGIAGDYTRLFTDKDDNFNINPIQNLGINKISPSFKLDVNGSVNGTSYYLNGVLKSNQFHDSLTIGTANGLTRTGKQVLNLGLSSTSTTGALSNTDWNTFNNKIGGSGTANYVAKFTASGTIENSLIQDNGVNLGLGTAPNSSYIARFGSGDVLFGGAIKGITYGTASNYWQTLQTSTTASVTTGFSASVSSNATPTVPERSSPALVMLARAYKTSDLSSQPNTMIVRVRGISGTTTSGALTIENSYVDGVANSNEVARFTTGGYLGIGINSPQNMLHINDGANATYTQITNTATGSIATDGSKIGIESDGDLAIVQQENDSIKLFTNSTLAASINGSGYISYKSSFADILVIGNITAQSIANGATYVKLTHYDTNGESSNCTADAANDKITITKKGRYRITANSTSYTANAGVTFTFRIFAGGTAISTIAPSERKFATANDITGGIMQGFYNASSVPVDIDVRAVHDSGTSQNITVKNSNLNVEYLGE